MSAPMRWASTTRYGKPLSPGSRWGGWRCPRRWRISRCTSPATRAPTRRARTSSPTAGSRFRRGVHPPEPLRRSLGPVAVLLRPIGPGLVGLTGISRGGLGADTLVGLAFGDLEDHLQVGAELPVGSGVVFATVLFGQDRRSEHRHETNGKDG